MSLRRADAMLLAAVIVLGSFPVPARGTTVIRFDDIAIPVPQFRSVPGGRYQALGVHFTFVDSTHGTTFDSLWAVPAGFAGHGATSAPNSAAIWGGEGQRLRAEFFDALSATPAVVDFVSAMVGDDSGEPDLVTLEAFDAAGALLGQSQFFSPSAGVYGLVSVTAPGIRRVELFEASSGADMDDFTFGTLTKLGVTNASSEPTFALGTPYPQPLVAGAARVEFTLADASPATLELYDIHGRRRFTSDVGVLGAGRHSVPLERAERLGAGLYFVRLRQGAASRFGRLIVTR